MTDRGAALHGIPPVAIEDIRDLRQYIGRIIEKRWAQLPADEQDEMGLEAIAIVYELHKRWDRAKCKSFRQYCSTTLPLRLIDYWRKEMRRRNGTQHKWSGGRTSADGGVYEHADVVSLNALSREVSADNLGRKRHMEKAA